MQAGSGSSMDISDAMQSPQGDWKVQLAKLIGCLARGAQEHPLCLDLARLGSSAGLRHDT